MQAGNACEHTILSARIPEYQKTLIVDRIPKAMLKNMPIDIYI
jgi:hypothetical protein